MLNAVRLGQKGWNSKDVGQASGTAIMFAVTELQLVSQMSHIKCAKPSGYAALLLLL
ncbi:MAG: hypothetical protein CLLPBCKN_002230 [Chroococcidiopsis cubana SAG 39.79]|nr:hypothetical protein [Chroococcidiopsis cubana SAG 39.79]